MKKSTIFLTLAATTLLFVSILTSCNTKTEKVTATIVVSTFNMTTAMTEIVASNKEFMAFFAASDSVGLANLYTQDAKFMNAGAPAITGRENIQSAFSGIMNSGVSSAVLTTVDVWGTEKFLTEEGEVSLFVDEEEVYQGKYMVLWKKEDGKWKLFRDIFNSNLPAEH